MMKKFSTLAIAALLLASPLLNRWLSHRIAQRQLHRKVQSVYLLNEAQKRELLPLASQDRLEIYRYRNPKGVWQTSPANLPELKELMLLGVLHRFPHPPEITRPVYLCRYLTNHGEESLSLDPSPTCPGDRAAQPEPLGFVSRDIRTGYLLMVRCYEPGGARYLTLNPHCESEADHADGIVGAIRAGNN